MAGADIYGLLGPLPHLDQLRAHQPRIVAAGALSLSAQAARPHFATNRGRSDDLRIALSDFRVRRRQSATSNRSTRSPSDFGGWEDGDVPMSPRRRPFHRPGA